MKTTLKVYNELKPVYEAVYLLANGKPIEITFSKGWVHIDGQKVRLKRLPVMIKYLEQKTKEELKLW